MTAEIRLLDELKKFMPTKEFNHAKHTVEAMMSTAEAKSKNNVWRNTFTENEAVIIFTRASIYTNHKFVKERITEAGLLLNFLREFENLDNLPRCPIGRVIPEETIEFKYYDPSKM